MQKLILLSAFLFAVAANAYATEYLYLDFTVTQKGLCLQNQNPNAQYTYVISQQSGTGQTQFSATNIGTFTTTLQFVVNTNGAGNGCTDYYIKGTTVGTSNIRFCGLDGGGCIGPDAWEVVTIDTLVFQDIDSTTDTNPNTGGGRRIYPDKQSPTDNVNRKIVRVKATLSGTANNMPIYFKSFDMDDPSSNTSPVDPDTGGTNAGDDNRGTNKPGILSQVGQSGTTNTLTVNTNSSGIAEADFQVTMYAGNNFMVAASGDDTFLGGIVLTSGGITLKDAGNNTLPVTKAKATPLLTTWRHINIEVDNMGTPGSNNHFAGNTLSLSYTGNDTVINLDILMQDHQRFIPGKIYINHAGTFNVIGATSSSVTVSGHQSRQVVGQTFTLYDDDDYDSENPHPWNGDEDETGIASLSAFSKMQTSDNPADNVYAPAYMMPVYNGGGNTNNNSTNVSWIENIAAASQEAQLNNNRQATGSDDYWVGYFQVAYQYTTPLDFDPNSEANAILGGTPGTNQIDSVNSSCATMPAGWAGSFLFQETTRDIFLALNSALDNLVAPHELGHQFGLKGDASNFGIMGNSINLSNFVPAHIHMLRCRVKTPGA